MRREVYRIDKDGYYTEPVNLDEYDDIPIDCIPVKPPNLFRVRWADGKWVQGISDEEVEKIEEKENARNELIELETRLRDTDWYAIRKVETGEGIPNEILLEREQARERISALRNMVE